MFRPTLILFLLLAALAATAQQDLPTDYLTPAFHKGRRDAARALMPDSSVLVVAAYPTRNYSNDVDYKYHPNPDLYYFTGYKEPNALLFLFKEAQRAPDGSTYHELFFVQDRNPQAEQWQGRRLGPEGVRRQLGITAVRPLQHFVSKPIELAPFRTILVDALHADVRDDVNDTADLFDALRVLRKQAAMPADLNPMLTTMVSDFIHMATPQNLARIQAYMKESAPPIYSQHPLFTRILGITDAASLAAFKEEQSRQRINTTAYLQVTGKLREIKTPEEMVLLRKAVEISCNGQNEVMKTLRPDMSEAEVQGLHEYVHKKYGAESLGYGSIIGAGENGCTLHYMENNRTRVGNNMVLMDVGAEYHGYTADVTRTIPADGRFSAEERAIYQLVYDAQEAAFKVLKDSARWRDASEAAKKVIAKGLVQLGITRSEAEVDTYYPHGLMHHIGLDVHDREVTPLLLKGMVVTVEPGIYIKQGSECDKKWWGIGVRIEDDVLIREKDYELLSHFAPRSVEAIEKLMAEKSVLDNFRVPELKSAKKAF